MSRSVAGQAISPTDRGAVIIMRMGDGPVTYGTDEPGLGHRYRDWPDGALYMVIAAEAWPEVQGPAIIEGREQDDGVIRVRDNDRIECQVAVFYAGTLTLVEPGKWWRLVDHTGPVPRPGRR